SIGVSAMRPVTVTFLLVVAPPLLGQGTQPGQAKVQVEVLLDKAVVLRYAGDTVAEALNGKNKAKPSKRLNDKAKVDEKDARFGKLASVRVKATLSGRLTEFTLSNLYLIRKDKESNEWELTEDAIEQIKKKLK